MRHGRAKKQDVSYTEQWKVGTYLFALIAPKEPQHPQKGRREACSTAQVVGKMIALVYLAFVVWVLALRETIDPLPGSSGT